MRRWLALIVLVSLVAALIGFSVFNYAGASVSSRQRLMRVLDSYASRRMLADSPLASHQFRRPSTSQFAMGSTFSEVAQEVGEGSEGELISSREFLEEAVTLFTAGTKFEDRWHINELTSAEDLTILLVNDDPRNIAGGRGCVYIGTLNVIVCNMRYIEDMFADIESIEELWTVGFVDTRTGKQQLLHELERREIRRLLAGSFLLWVLGHEIGHAVLHGTFAHTTVHDAGELTSTDYDAREVEADDFVIKQLVNAHRDDASWVANMVIAFNTLLEHEYRKHVPASRIAYWDGQGKDEIAGRESIVVACGKYELPLVVRIVRLLESATRQQPGLDDTGHYILAKEAISLEYRTINKLAALACVALALLLSASLHFRMS